MPTTLLQLTILSVSTVDTPLVWSLTARLSAHSENIRAFSRFFFHPRVLRAVSRCDPSTSILGHKSSLPIFVSGAALAKLGHPLGEANITKGAGLCNIIQMLSTNASLSSAQISAARVSPEQTLFFQLYKKKEDALALELIREVEALGYSAIFLTVDAVVPGSRERDIKAPWVLEDQEREAEGKPQPVDDPQDEADGNTLGTAGELITGNDGNMTWEKVCTPLSCFVYPPNRIGPDDPLVEESDTVTDRDQGCVVRVAHIERPCYR